MIQKYLKLLKIVRNELDKTFLLKKINQILETIIIFYQIQPKQVTKLLI